jgi:hypothetical protein
MTSSSRNFHKRMPQALKVLHKCAMCDTLGIIISMGIEEGITVQQVLYILSTQWAQPLQPPTGKENICSLLKPVLVSLSLSATTL